MRMRTTDPITGNDVINPATHPFVIEGSGENALKIYFESEDSKRAYLDIEVEHPDEDLPNLDNAARMGEER